MLIIFIRAKNAGATLTGVRVRRRYVKNSIERRYICSGVAASLIVRVHFICRESGKKEADSRYELF